MKDRLGEISYTNKNHHKMEIIEYNGNKNIIVRFDDGSTKKTSYWQFKNGGVRFDNEYVGEINKNTFGTQMMIIKNLKNRMVRIKFLDEYEFEKDITYENFKNGYVANPYDKKIFGVGYDGEINVSKYISEYTIWKGMLSRCYCEKDDSYYNYGRNGVKVCNEWFCFKNFVEWYNNNKYELPNNEKIQIDKDILYRKNKLYSPSTCLLVPQSINQIIVVPSKRKLENKALPIGVSKKIFNNGTVKYYAEISKNKKYYFIGSYDNEDDAYFAYKKEKEKAIKELANKYKDYLPKATYDAICDYKIEKYTS